MTTTMILERLKGFMRGNAVRQQIVSERTGIDKHKISRLINGKQMMTLEEFTSICNAIGVQASEVLDANTQIPPAKEKPRIRYPKTRKPIAKQDTLIDDLIMAKVQEIQQPATRFLGIAGIRSDIPSLQMSVDDSLRKYPSKCDNYHGRMCGVVDRFVHNRRLMLGIGSFRQGIMR